MHSHSSMSGRHASITRSLSLSGEQCKEAEKTGIYYVSNVHWDISWPVKMTMNTEELSVFTDGKKMEGEINCDDSGYITKYTFTSRMFKENLTYDSDTGTLSEAEGVLPATYETGYVDSVGRFQAAFAWNPKQECAIVKVRRPAIVTMIHWKTAGQYFITNDIKTTNPQVRQHFQGSNATDQQYIHHDFGFDNLRVMTVDQEPMFKIEVNKEEEHLCQDTKIKLHGTNHDHLFVEFLQGGYNMHTGEPMPAWRIYDAPEYENGRQGVNWLRLYGTTKIKKEHASARGESIEEFTLIETNTTKDLFKEEIHVATDMNIKLDFLMYQQTQMLRISEISLLKSMCELERTQILTILALAVQNAQLAGYLLTGKRSNYVTTDGAIAYLYTCTERRSPFIEQKTCYDRIPISYMEETWFVDPITRHTHKDATETDCNDQSKNYFHMDLQEPESWDKVQPWLSPAEQPLHFEPKKTGYITPYNQQASAINAGLYNKEKMGKFWRRIQSKNFEEAQMIKFKQTLAGTHMTAQQIKAHTERIQKGGFFSGQGPIYLDNFISPTFFVNAFKSTFGKAQYRVEKCGIYFGVFMLTAFGCNMVFNFIRTFEIRRITKNTMGFSKLILGSIFQTFWISAMYNIILDEVKANDPANNNRPPNNATAPSKYDYNDKTKEQETTKLGSTYTTKCMTQPFTIIDVQPEKPEQTKQRNYPDINSPRSSTPTIHKPLPIQETRRKLNEVIDRHSQKAEQQLSDEEGEKVKQPLISHTEQTTYAQYTQQPTRANSFTQLQIDNNNPMRVQSPTGLFLANKSAQEILQNSIIGGPKLDRK